MSKHSRFIFIQWTHVSFYCLVSRRFDLLQQYLAWTKSSCVYTSRSRLEIWRLCSKDINYQGRREMREIEIIDHWIGMNVPWCSMSNQTCGDWAQAGQSGWITTSSFINKAALDVRNHLEFQRLDFLFIFLVFSLRIGFSSPIGKQLEDC